ncbi:EAL domain-containing protein [Buttiauxella gaviniae]|uniref:cyclic-guanylate-specific phosphodiesterase n=1 Tax=Buttiauxella gaviniae TaxID=82990 RepID=A0ABV3NWR3_9ENTR
MSNPLVRPIIINPYARLFISLLLFIVLISSGLSLLHYQFVKTMKASTSDLANQLINKTENILVHSENTSLLISDLLGKPCTKKMIEKMQNVVAEGLYLRNTSVFRDGKIYCSSAPEVVGMPIRTADKFYTRHILLFTDRFVTKGVPLFALRIDRNNLGIVTIIDGRYVQNMLEIMNNRAGKLVSYLKVGDSWIEGSGEVHNTILPELNFVTSLQGRRMPVNIIVGVKGSSLWKQFWSEYWFVISSVALASLLCAIFIYQILSRPYKTKTVLRKALKRNEFMPWLQGVVDKNGKICGAEVLMRWQNRDNKIISPDIFIPAAEESGLIVPMTSSLLQPLQHFLLQNLEALPADFVLSINISKFHFQDMRLAEECRNFLNPFPEKAISLCLEITERELIEQTPLTDELLKQLHNMGVKIAIDDFGTGHASFNYLKAFKVDFLKIDRSYINTIGTPSVSASLVDIIINMAKKLEIDVVAEGVENKEQADYVIKHSVNKLQGFYYHKPVPLLKFGELLNNDL